jgi:uncharacterized DUF497 family protein
VNILVENENIGTTSEENGEFTIYTSEKSKRLIFSVLGFEKKIVSISQAQKVFLTPKTIELDEVIVANMLETKQLVIGQTENTISQAFDNGPRIDVKFFPYDPVYKKTKYIKYVTINTDSKIESATIKLHFYRVNDDGSPGEELLKKDKLVTVNFGSKSNKINLSKHNLLMPKKGVFVGYEKLMIEKNKKEKTVKDANTNTTQIQKVYYPFVLYNYVERDFLFTYSGGKWHKETKEIAGLPSKISAYEPAINLILTN